MEDVEGQLTQIVNEMYANQGVLVIPALRWDVTTSDLLFSKTDGGKENSAASIFWIADGH